MQTTARSLVLSALALAAVPAGPSLAGRPQPIDRGWGFLKLDASQSELKKAGGKMACSPVSETSLTDYAAKVVRSVSAPGAETCTITYDEESNEFLSAARATLVGGKTVVMELDYKPTVGTYKEIVQRSSKMYGTPTVTEEIDGSSYAVWDHAPTRLVLVSFATRRGKPTVARYEDVAVTSRLLGTTAAASAPAQK